MNKRGIIDSLSRDRVVEQLVVNITHRALRTELLDLVQMVYMILLETDEAKLADLWDHDEIRFYIVRLIKNQYCSRTSRFHYTYRVYEKKNRNIDDYDFQDGDR